MPLPLTVMSGNVNVEFKVTLHEQVRYRGSLQYYRLQSVTQLDTMVKSTMTEITFLYITFPFLVIISPPEQWSLQ